MRTKTVVLALMSALAISSIRVHAQAGAAAATAARLATPAPTGSLSALTKAASGIRASRAAALSGKGLTSGAGGQIGRSTQQIMGYLWTSNNGAIGDATVQIRNTVTNSIDAIVKTNTSGEFLFQNVNPGEYVIEYVRDSAKKLVEAVGHPFTVSPGETVATFVRLSNGLPMLLPNELSNLTSNVATQAVTSAASEGVTAIATPLVNVVPPVIPPSTGGNQPPPPSPPAVVSAIR
jgi:hypothetical protein